MNLYRQLERLREIGAGIISLALVILILDLLNTVGPGGYYPVAATSPQISREQMTNQAPGAGRVSYFAPRLGPTHSTATYRELYPGIDLAYRSDHERAKYRFLVAPSADVGDIKLAYKGVSSLEIGRQGSLFLKAGSGMMKKTPPIAYQVVEGKTVRRKAVFSLHSNVLGFSVADYDPARPLVISTVLTRLAGK